MTSDLRQAAYSTAIPVQANVFHFARNAGKKCTEGQNQTEKKGKANEGEEN